jgi:hypothetical protein
MNHLDQWAQWAAIGLLYVLFILFWCRLLAINSRLDWDVDQLQQGLESERDRKRSRLTGNWWGPDR